MNLYIYLFYNFIQKAGKRENNGEITVKRNIIQNDLTLHLKVNILKLAFVLLSLKTYNEA